ncbi:hypothetical protein FISHEDRAFT_60749 [Fistulina hepatica ATCC 64428]|uniref:Uncharacterized protein n=1 Tax=Fistulina hepatica ATCC 64428 TaxID=1128425 RepID=A0A0D7A510_9AGAR|nr:hypothetical protein FISHEDRAFT_60749 [Fistulina hepatica ATCC 64428]
MYSTPMYSTPQTPAIYPPSTPAPMQPPAMSPQTGAPTSTTVEPGALTYTTSVNEEGRVIYHPFKATPASYRMPNGQIVSGIQWVPAEATQIIPQGAQPAAPILLDSDLNQQDFVNSWKNGLPANSTDYEWQRDEDRRRRREEKEAKRLSRSRLRSASRGPPVDPELARAREADAASAARRERRQSFNAGAYAPGQTTYPGGSYAASQPVTQPVSYGAAGIPGGTSPYTSPYTQPATVMSPYAPTTTTMANAYTSPYAPVATAATTAPYGAKYTPSSGLTELEHQMDSMNLGRSDPYGMEAGKIAGLGRPRKYSTHAPSAEDAFHRQSMYGAPVYGAPSRSHSPYYGATALPGAAPVRPVEYPTPLSRSHSPYYGATAAAAPTAVRPGETYTGAAGTSVYFPPSPIRPVTEMPQPYAGQPATAAVQAARSRATTPLPGASSALPQTAVYPTGVHDTQIVAPGQLPPPACFLRPVNAAQTYTPFGPMKILNMDDFKDMLPRLPLVLQTHDVFHDDWIRAMQDLASAWTEQLQVPAAATGRRPRRSRVAADLIETWNERFFAPRAVEIVLYKGRERRTGPKAGVEDLDDDRDNDSDSDLSEESDIDSDDDANEQQYGLGAYGTYGRTAGMSDVMDTRRRRRGRDEDKRRRRRERQRRKERTREKVYTLYLTYVPPSGAGMAMPNPASYGY